ncbi:MAG: DEAD/DEAH box helicase [Cyanobacteria bacterium J06656_5]
MIPSVIASEVRSSVSDFLKTTFRHSTHGFEGLMDRFLADGENCFKGPYVSIALPFRTGSSGPDYFPDVPLDFPPHRHQEQAFDRLKSPYYRSTLIATGTGSGKTECFLQPILDHCHQHRREPGIKALLIYPMNALATDQAKRIAKAIYNNPKLKGHVTAGLFVGESEKNPRAIMTEDGIITDKNILRHNPPDILLTNYKMLDYLLVRPRDKKLWSNNQPETLRYLVVDEIHTFDGAQGTDLACLIRRLKARLKIPENHLACVGTSATLGGSDGKADMLKYASGVFETEFDKDAVIQEDRLSPDEFLQAVIKNSGVEGDGQADLLNFMFEKVRSHLPGLEHLDALNPAHYTSLEAYIRAQHQLWLDQPLEGPFDQMHWRLNLGSAKGLIHLDIVIWLLPILASGATDINEIWQRLGRKLALPENVPEIYKTALLDSLLALMAMARRYAMVRSEESPEEQKSPQPILPWVNLRVQFWQRELRRMVATVEATPRLVFSDDQTADAKAKILPVLNCRECGSTGWGGLRRQTSDRQIGCDLQDFYIAYFGNSPLTVFVFPTKDMPAISPTERQNKGLNKKQGWTWYQLCTACLSLNQGAGKVCTACGHDELIPVWEPNMVKEIKNKQTGNIRRESHHDCPFCDAKDGLSIIGSRAASLSSVVIGNLFASAYNQDRKLITFSDSVQDAAHRAGFFSARTFRTTLRTALYQYIEQQTNGQPLDEVVKGFQQQWLARLGSAADYIATFIPTDMQWLGEWEALQNTGTISGQLHEFIDRRLDWEIVADMGLRSTIGRSLERMGACSVHIASDRLQATVNHLLPRLRNEIGALHSLDRDTLTRFLLGLLCHLRQRGGILHPESNSYLEQNGNSYLLQQRIFMPGFGPGSRVPMYFSDQSRAFERVLTTSDRKTWCYQWAFKNFAIVDDELSLVAEQFPTLYDLTLEALVDHNILDLRYTRSNHRVWALHQSALVISPQAQVLACDLCGDPGCTNPIERDGWVGTHCLQPHCSGHYQPVAEAGFDFYQKLYSRGEVWRIFAQEHTGLLQREVREQLEDRFINGTQRSDPNLLSATSTLEMGINIGDLSSTLLCSVPPTQANYQQRIGRAGRRDGNAFVGAIANGRPHDLYYWSKPLDMISGGVSTPGFYLKAAAILQRQLTAFCLDRWVAEEAQPLDLPDKFAIVLDAVIKASKGKIPKQFPYTWLGYIETHQSELLENFLRLFEGQILERTQEQLRLFMEKGNLDEGGLRWKILNRLTEVVEERKRLRNRIELLRRRIKEKEAGPKGQNHEEELDELKRERSGLMDLVQKINQKNTLNFFTDEGLLPNYAFPEAGVTLKSIIWRQRMTQGDAEQGKYETLTFEYERPGAVAIGELVPSGTFYAEGRRVNIDQIDLNLSKIKEWRFCNNCSYAIEADLPQGKQKTCPRCSSVMWADEGRKCKMLQLRQVMATSSDRNSRIGDDRDERSPAFFTKQMLADFEPTAREETYVFDDEEFPFGFEFIGQTTFREVNFGEATHQAKKIEIAGVSRPRSGFAVCKHCGKVQTSKTRFKHTLSCKAPNPDDEKTYADILYLFRQFESESLRILMPVDILNFPEKLHSFIAALQLGLKLHFKGNVDHLRVLISEEPQPNSTLRRPYLFLYDTVPGGTGYLKQLLRHNDDLMSIDFMSVFEKALAVTENCSCEDGCYECLFAYRNSFDQDKTSRNTANSILKAILERQNTLKKTDESLSGVKLNALFDSVLEQRFIEALRRYRYKEQPTIVRKVPVNGKAGYFIKLGDQAWNVEPQVDLGPHQDVAVPSRADFVFWPAKQTQDLKPIVIFTDGWEYHCDRIGRDFLQRMAIVQSGKFRVWSLSWSDVEAQFNQSSTSSQTSQNGYVDLLKLGVSDQFHQGQMPLLKHYNCSELQALTSESSFVWLTHYLANPQDAKWTGLALVRTIAQLDPKRRLDDGWLTDFTELADSRLIQAAGADSSGRRLGHIKWHSPDGVCLMQSYISIDTNRHKGRKPDSTCVFTWLDDRDFQLPNDIYTQLWTGVLRQYNLLQFLTHSYVLTHNSQATVLPELISILPEPPADADEGQPLSPQWQKLFELAEEITHPLINHMAHYQWPIPELGYELADDQDAALAEAEFAWPDHQVAILLSPEQAPIFSEQGWQAVCLDTLQTNPEEFRTRYLSD